MTITSKTDICNLALDLLSAETVVDVDQPTSALESLLDRWYDQCRKKLLREHPWNFAIKRAQLSASNEVVKFGYSNKYPFPNDFVRFLNIESDLETIVPTSAYEVEDKALLYNSDSGIVNVRYIYDCQDVSKFDPLFIDLLSYEIALSVCYKVTNTNTNVERLAKIYSEKSRLTKAIDGQERPPTRREYSRNMSVRRLTTQTRDDRIVF